MYLSFPKNLNESSRIFINDHDHLTGPGISSRIGATHNKTQFRLLFGTTVRYDHIFFRQFDNGQLPTGYLESVKSILLDYSLTISKKFQLNNRGALIIVAGFNLMNRESEFSLYEMDTVTIGASQPILISSSSSLNYNAYYLGCEFEFDDFSLGIGGFLPEYVNKNFTSNRYFILPEIILGYRIK